MFGVPDPRILKLSLQTSQTWSDSPWGVVILQIPKALLVVVALWHVLSINLGLVFFQERIVLISSPN